jgi:hypothetical protein
MCVCNTMKQKPALQLLQRLDSTRAMHPFVVPLESSVHATEESLPFVQNETSVCIMTRCRDNAVSLGMINFSKWRREYAERQARVTSTATENRLTRGVAPAGRECSTNSRHDPKASVLGQGNITPTAFHLKSKYPFVRHFGKTSILPQTQCSNPGQSKPCFLKSVHDFAIAAKHRFDPKSRFSASARQLCSRQMSYRYEFVDDIVLV